jgi:hypothetical protein
MLELTGTDDERRKKMRKFHCCPEKEFAEGSTIDLIPIIKEGAANG